MIRLIWAAGGLSALTGSGALIDRSCVAQVVVFKLAGGGVLDEFQALAPMLFPGTNLLGGSGPCRRAPVSRVRLKAKGDWRPRVCSPGATVTPAGIPSRRAACLPVSWWFRAGAGRTGSLPARRRGWFRLQW